MKEIKEKWAEPTDVWNFALSALKWFSEVVQIEENSIDFSWAPFLSIFL